MLHKLCKKCISKLNIDYFHKLMRIGPFCRIGLHWVRMVEAGLLEFVSIDDFEYFWR